MATRKGLEPSTSGVTGRHSNQLNYRAAILLARLSLINLNTTVTVVGGTGVEPVTYAL